MSEDKRESIYSKFISKRKLFLRTQINQDTSTNLIVQLMYLEEEHPGKEIQLYLTSKGGEVNSGLAIYDVMQSISSPVSTICLGEAQSMAAILLAGGENGRRYILPNSTVMIHQPNYTNLSGSQSFVKDYVDQITRSRNKLEEILAKHTGKPIEEITKHFDKEYFLNAREAKEYGIIDHIVTSLGVLDPEIELVIPEPLEPQKTINSPPPKAQKEKSKPLIPGADLHKLAPKK